MASARVGEAGEPSFLRLFFSEAAVSERSKQWMKPARFIPAERVAPLGQRFCASVSDAKLGKITVRPAPARPVPRPAQLAKLAGRLVAPWLLGLAR